MEINKGFVQTEIGLFPYDWAVYQLNKMSWFQEGPGLRNWQFTNNGIKVINVTNLENGTLNLDRTDRHISLKEFHKMYEHFEIDEGDIVVASSGNSYGKVAVVRKQDLPLLMNTSVIRFKPLSNIDYKYLLVFLKSNSFKKQLDLLITGGAQPNFGPYHLDKILIPSPPTKTEQTAIATALSNIDELIAQTEKLIEKKKAIKQGGMQELLKPKEGWVTKKLGEVCDVLDNLRKPLNDSERQSMKGDIPYCGANGIVGFVNDYVIDDDIILMAEDGGYFDEYKTRPIAYQMNGKCWVNNHAHILKSKKDYDQNFIFYSLVNKNILDYINGGTRAKLNKGEMVNIVLSLPQNIIEQTKIAKVFIDLSQNIAMLETKLIKLKYQKQGMMQALLTGKIRLL